MRKTYETEEDRKREQETVNHIQKYMGDMKISPSLPYSYTVDRAVIINADIRAWLEIKCQQYKLEYYTLPEYWLSLRKANEGIQWARVTKRPFFLIATFSDVGVRFTEITLDCLQNYKIEYGGRTITQRDAEDQELILKIPVDNFYKIEELKERIQ